MKITVLASYKYLKKGELLDKTAVVIDILRATSTIVTAIQNGCDRIIPANSPNEAAEIKKFAEGDVLLGGEKGSIKISGFDLGNSPMEYTEENVFEKIIAFSTTNGSVAIKKCDEAAALLIAAILNAEAVAQKVLDIGRDTVLVCAGTNNNFSTDDVIAAGCILDRILNLENTVELDDLGRIAIKLYRDAKGDYLKALAGSSHFEYLIKIGLKKDVEFCMQEDIYDVVPIYKEGVISI